jgi:hypothetical protein
MSAWEPIASGKQRAAAEPVEDPPVQREVSHEWRTGPNPGLCGPPMANSVVASLVTAMAPASSAPRTTSAERCAIRPS